MCNLNEPITGWLYRQKGTDVASWKAFLLEAGLKYENNRGFLCAGKTDSIEKCKQIDQVTAISFKHNVERIGVINLLPL